MSSNEQLVMTLVANDCECTETGECTCEEDACTCSCECNGCSNEMISSCACGGNCACGNSDSPYDWE